MSDREQLGGTVAPLAGDGTAADQRASSVQIAEQAYRGFISYSHKDSRWSAWLHRELESFQVPKELRGRATSQGPVPQRLGRFYRDEAEEGAASDLGARIERALALSGALIVICSPASRASNWVQQEILQFKTLGRANRIFLMVVEGEIHAADPSQECLPRALERSAEEGISAQAPWHEPLAVDVRKFDREDSLLRLISGILDLDYDELKRRELVRQRRRARRNALLGVAGLALAAVAITAAFVALNQRSAALLSLAKSRAAELAARARSIEAERPEVAVTLAMRSLRALEGYGTKSRDGEAALRSAMARTRGRRAYCMPALREAGSDDARSFDFAADSSLLAIGNRAQALCVFRSTLEGKFELLDVLQSYGAGVEEARFTSDGKWLVSVAGGQYPRALPLATTILDPDAAKFTAANYEFQTFGETDEADAVSIDAAATRIAFAPVGISSIEVWRLSALDPDGEPEQRLEVTGTVLATAFSTDGRYLAALTSRESAESLRSHRPRDQSGELGLALHVWGIETGEHRTLAPVLTEMAGYVGEGIGMGRVVGRIAVGAGGRWVAAAIQMTDQHSVAEQFAAEVWAVPAESAAQRLRVFDGGYEDKGEEWARVTRFGFTPDWFYAAHDREVRLWPLDQNAIRRPAPVTLRSPYAHAGARKALGVIYDVDVAPDARRIAATDSNGVLTVWDLAAKDGESARPAFFVESPGGSLRSGERVRFSSDSKYVMSAGSEGAVLFCTLDDQCGPTNPQRTVPPSNEVQWRSWSHGPKGAWLAGVSEVNRVYFWRQEQIGLPFFVADMSGEDGNDPVTTRAYAIVSGSPGNAVRLVSSDDGNWVAAYKEDQYGFNRTLSLIRLAPDPAQFAVLLDGMGCEQDKERGEAFYAVSFDMYARRLYLASKWGCVAALSLPASKEASTKALSPVREQALEGVWQSFSSRYIVSSSPWSKEVAALWTRRAEDGGPRNAIQKVGKGTILLAPDESWVFSAGSKVTEKKEPDDDREHELALEPDLAKIEAHGVQVAKLDRDASSLSWQTLVSFNSKVALAVSPDGKWLVATGELAVGDGKSAILWRVGQFDVAAARWKVDFAAEPAIIFDQKSSRLLVGPQGFPNDTGKVPPHSIEALLVDLRKSKPTAETLSVIIGDYDSGCWSSSGFSCEEIEYSFSADGSFLASSDPGNVWGIAAGRARHLAFLNEGLPKFSDWGPWMATIGARGAEIWSIDAGKAESRGFWSSGGSVYFPPGGERLLTLSNGVIFDQTLTVDALVHRAAGQIGRNPNMDEWRDEFLDEPYAKTFDELPAHPSYIDDLMLRAERKMRDRRAPEAAALFSAAAEEAVRLKNVNACRLLVRRAVRAGLAKSVLAAADFGVTTLARSSYTLETRGIARAAAGLTKEAIEDFENANKLRSSDEDVARRKFWVERLQAGATIPVEELYDY